MRKEVIYELLKDMSLTTDDLKEYISKISDDEKEELKLYITDLRDKYHQKYKVEGIVPRLVREIYTGRKKSKTKKLLFETLRTRINNNDSKGNIDISIDDLIEKIETLEYGFDEIYQVKIAGISDSISIIEMKITYWDTDQMVKKIQMNSLYGALGNKYFVLFNRDIASSITGNGRAYIKGMSNYVMRNLKRFAQKIGAKMPFGIYNDTDSFYVSVEGIVEYIIDKKIGKPYEQMDLEEKTRLTKMLEKFAEKYIDSAVIDFTKIYADYFNSYDRSVIGAKLEKIADSGLFIAKKKYALRVIYSEGDIMVAKPKIAVTGLEIVRSSTPHLCRVELKKVLPLILDKGESEVREFVNKVKEKFFTADIEEISRVSSVNDLGYEFINGKFRKVKNTNGFTTYQTAPINSTASLTHNLTLRKLDLDKDYQPITEKDKLKYVHLKIPNPFENQNVFGYIEKKVLEEAGVDKYYDLETMFEKSFLSPIKMMTDVIGYDVSKAQFNEDEWI